MKSSWALLKTSTFVLLSRGKFGLSNHRSSRGLAIGGKPPYLMVKFKL